MNLTKTTTARLLTATAPTRVWVSMMALWGSVDAGGAVDKSAYL